MAATTASSENEEIARRFIDEVVNQGNDEVIDELVAEDLIDHTPLGETRGREAMRETTEELKTAFPDFAVTIHDVVADEDTVAVRMTQRGTLEGPFMGAEPTGRSFEIDAMGFVRVEDGQIAERWVRPDLLGLLSQVGVVEPPGA